MFPYGLQNYSPRPDPTEPIPETVKTRARMLGAEFIHPKTRNIYRWHGDVMQIAYSPEYESWWQITGEMPAGELEKL